MRSSRNNYAFIDSQNLNLSIRELGWSLDFMNNLEKKLGYQNTLKLRVFEIQPRGNCIRMEPYEPPLMVIKSKISYNN